MKWLLIVAAVWYWWRLYSLSFNPSGFPDPTYAHAVWDRRSRNSFFLGAAIVTAFLYLLGVIHVWWAGALTYAISFVAVVFVQPMLVGAFILVRTGGGAARIDAGLTPRSHGLAPLAWRYYLPKEPRL